MEFKTADDVEKYIYSSYVETYPQMLGGEDTHSRNPWVIRQLLGMMGYPDRKQRNIMITGSKGKGSLSLMVAKLLEGHGKKIGLFTSPHLQSYRERIRINGAPISEERLVALGNEIYPFCEEVKKGFKPHQYFGPVGLTAVMASQYFLEEGTDFNVIECGRGARYDDVNQIEGFICAINRVFLEHEGPLGYTLQDVAHHKSGVIKEGMVGVYSAYQDKYAELEIRFESRKKNVPLHIYGMEFEGLSIKDGIGGTVLDIRTPLGVYEDIHISLLGKHQGENGALAVAICEEVLGRRLDIEIVREVMKNLHWPGRLEIVREEPLTLLDGCIGVESLAYIENVLKNFGCDDVVLVVGIPEDKNYLGVIKKGLTFSKKVILTHAKNDYLKFSKDQVEKAKKLGDVDFRESVGEAIELGEESLEKGSLLLLLGTQSFIKDVKTYFGQSTLYI